MLFVEESLRLLKFDMPVKLCGQTQVTTFRHCTSGPSPGVKDN